MSGAVLASVLCAVSNVALVAVVTLRVCRLADEVAYLMGRLRDEESRADAIARRVAALETAARRDGAEGEGGVK